MTDSYRTPYKTESSQSPVRRSRQDIIDRYRKGRIEKEKRPKTPEKISVSPERRPRSESRSPYLESLRKNTPIYHEKKHSRNPSYEVVSDDDSSSSDHEISQPTNIVDYDVTRSTCSDVTITKPLLLNDVTYTFSKPKQAGAPTVTILRDFVGSPEVMFSPTNTQLLVEEAPPDNIHPKYTMADTPELFENSDLFSQSIGQQ